MLQRGINLFTKKKEGDGIMKRSRSVKLLVLLLALMVVLVGCSSPGSSDNEEGEVEESGDVTHITIGTAGVGGMNYPIGMALAKIWNANVDGVKAVAIATNGAPHNIELLRNEEIEAAVCRSIEANLAINGEEPYPEEMPWIRAITGGLFYEGITVLAQADAGIETIYDFEGKRIAVGPVGSGGEVDARQILEAHGLSYDDITPEYIEASQAIEMMQDNLIDGAILGLTQGASSVSELMLGGDTIILPIDDEAAAKYMEISPYMEKRILPANVYPNQDYEVMTMGSPPDNIVARVELSDELAYEMTKSIYENIEEMQDVAAVMEQFTPELVAEEDDMLLPYHPGSKKYFVEQGWISE
jgi:hypothetical protein